MDPAAQTELSAFQADALFLLAGQNPLSNYVAARLLLKPGGALYLIHADGPEGAARAAHDLARHLAPFFPKRQFIPVDPAEPVNIRRQVETALAQRNPLGVIGLNYAGGTRIMAVHAYQVVEAYCGRSNAVFSHLDPDRLELIVEPRPGKPPFRRKVAQDLSLTLQEALALHGAELRSERQDESRLPDLARALAQMHRSLPGIVSWRKYSRAEMVSVWDGRLWEYAEEELRAGLLPSDLMAQLEAALTVNREEPVDLDAAAKRAGLKDARALIDWLAEGWLKDWALSGVKALHYSERTRDLVCAGAEEVRVDVAFMHGCQLFALYCNAATSLEKVRLDLLEAYSRTRQIGGDEARVGVVSFLNEPERLEQEIAHAWTLAGRVRVFGCRALPDLQLHLKAWIEGA